MFNFSRDDEGTVRMKPRYQDIRMSKHKHNPYVGSFHSVNRHDITEDRSGNFVNSKSGNVPLLRHAPASFSVSSGKSLGLKGLFQSEDLAVQVPMFTMSAPLMLFPTMSAVSTPTLSTSLAPMLSQNGTAPLDEAENNSYDREECGDGPSCSICLETYKDGDEMRSLHCNHCFHKKCVDIWLLGYLSSGTVNTCRCPQCRQEVKPDLGDSDILDSDTPSSSFLRIGESLVINEEIPSLSSSIMSDAVLVSVAPLEPESGSFSDSGNGAVGGGPSTSNNNRSITVDDDECLCGSGYSYM